MLIMAPTHNQAGRDTALTTSCYGIHALTNAQVRAVTCAVSDDAQASALLLALCCTVHMPVLFLQRK